MTATVTAPHALSLRHSIPPRFSVFSKPTKSFFNASKPNAFLSLSSPSTLILRAQSSDTVFFDDDLEPQEEVVFDPPIAPEDYVEPPFFDDGPMETEEQIAAAYEELYGPAYSGESVSGKDVYVMDAKTTKKVNSFGTVIKDKIRDGLEERVIQVRRVTKVVKGGRQLNFRAVVVVGDLKGSVGVGVGKAKEVILAVEKAGVNARRNLIPVPLTKYLSFPHRSEGKFGAATVMLRPASSGSGVIAGGAVRVVLELAGLQNALGKQLGSKNILNNARATVVAMQQMRQLRNVAHERGIPMEELFGQPVVKTS